MMEGYIADALNGLAEQPIRTSKHTQAGPGRLMT